MPKPVWIAVTLAVGIALGLIIARVGLRPSAAAAVTTQVPSIKAPAPRAAAGAPVVVPVPVPASARRASGSGAVAPLPQASAISPPADGAAFMADIENAPAPVYRDSMVEMHERFEREPRDDSWAYLREAEIESALVMETSMGNFRKQRIECRATICELELSANGEQVAALKKWYERVSALPPDAQPYSHLQFRMATYSTEDDGAAVKFVYVAPQAGPAPGN